MNKIYYLSSISLFFIQYATATIQYALSDIDAHTIKINITIPIQANDFLYKDYISFSVDHPDVQLSPWKSNIESTTHYNTRFKDSKKIFNKDVIITLTAQKKSDTITQAHLYFNYYLHSKNHIAEIIFPLITKNEQPATPERELSVTTPQHDASRDHKTTVHPNNGIDQVKDWYTTHLEPYATSIFIQITIVLFFVCILGIFLYFHDRKLFFIELKKIAVWLAIGLVIYISGFVFASHYMIYLAVLFCALSGILSIMESEKTVSHPWRYVKTAIGILLLSATLPLLFCGYKAERISKDANAFFQN